MRFALYLVATLLVAGAVFHQPAFAEDVSKTSPSNQAAAEPGKWSFGAGIGGFFSYEGTLVGGAGQLGLLGAPAFRGALATTLVERILTERLRLGVGLAGGYSSTKTDDDEELNSSDVKAQNLDAGLSLRYVLNPEDRVQLSPIVSLGGGWGRTSGFITGRDYDNTQGTARVVGHTEDESAGTYASVRAGLVLEYRLLDRLYLRLENMFVRSSYEFGETKSRHFRDGEKTTIANRDYRTFAINASVQPALQIRVIF